LGAATSISAVAIYKNGASALISVSPSLNTASSTIQSISGLLYMNGSTDYIETFVYQSNGGALNCGSATSNVSFSASMVRAA
jgi:hypothetical protein